MSESGGLGPDDPDDMAPAGQGVAHDRKDRLVQSRHCRGSGTSFPDLVSARSRISAPERSLRPLTPQARREVRRFHNPYSQDKTFILRSNSHGSQGVGPPTSTAESLLRARRLRFTRMTQRPGECAGGSRTTRPQARGPWTRSHHPRPTPILPAGNREEGARTRRSPLTPPPGPPPLLAHRTGIGRRGQ